MYYLTIALIQRDWSDRMEYNTASPIYLQVINELKKRMVKGELKPGEKMPSNRELAVLFKVNQNTAARIYREMESMGLCYTKRGIGTFVSEEDDMISGLKKEMQKNWSEILCRRWRIWDSKKEISLTGSQIIRRKKNDAGNTGM